MKMSILEKFNQEISELLEYKKKYESALKEKKRMAEKLFDLMLKEYSSLSQTDHKQKHIDRWCRRCRQNYECGKECIPDNVGEPCPSDGWIPGEVACPNFEWD